MKNDEIIISKWSELKKMPVEKLTQELRQETNPWVLDLFKNHLSVMVREAVGSSNYVSSETLTTMVLNGEMENEVLAAIVRNPKVSPYTQNHVFRSTSSYIVKMAFVENPSTPSGIRKALVYDSNPQVRLAVAKSTLTSKKDLKALSEDLSEDQDVRNAAMDALSSLQ